jgi:chromosome transmission fidelity protein 4
MLIQDFIVIAFNMIGVIEVTDQDTHQIINVEFHDKAIRRGYHFQDHFRFTMASLGLFTFPIRLQLDFILTHRIGTRGAVYATPSQPSTSGPSHASQITYKPYESWASSSTSSSEWQVSLPDGEEAIAVAAGGLPLSASDDDTDIPGGMGWVVAATSKGYVRFFSGAGIQRYLWNLGGDVVGLVAGAEWVFVVHREGGTSLDGSSNFFILCHLF